MRGVCAERMTGDEKHTDTGKERERRRAPAGGWQGGPGGVNLGAEAVVRVAREIVGRHDLRVALQVLDVRPQEVHLVRCLDGLDAAGANRVESSRRERVSRAGRAKGKR